MLYLKGNIHYSVYCYSVSQSAHPPSPAPQQGAEQVFQAANNKSIRIHRMGKLTSVFHAFQSLSKKKKQRRKELSRGSCSSVAFFAKDMQFYLEIIELIKSFWLLVHGLSTRCNPPPPFLLLTSVHCVACIFFFLEHDGDRKIRLMHNAKCIIMS